MIWPFKVNLACWPRSTATTGVQTAGTASSVKLPRTMDGGTAFDAFGYLQKPVPQRYSKGRRSGFRKASSDELREQGNYAYQQVSKSYDKDSKWATMQLERALDLYNEASKVAEDAQQAAASYKNAGVVNKWLAVRATDPGTATKHTVAAVGKLSAAVAHGLSCKEVAWLEGVKDTLAECLRMARSYAEMSRDRNGVDNTLAVLGQLAHAVHDGWPVLKTVLYQELAKRTFHLGIEALSVDDREGYMACLTAMHESRQPCLEALKCAREADWPEAIRDLSELESDIFQHQCISESLKERDRGDQMASKALLDDDSLDMEAVWDAIDLFTQSASLTRERDTVNEAIALQRLGQMYEKVLHMRDYASRYYRKSFELAQTFVPIPTTKHWYQDVVAQLALFQADAVAAEEAEKQKGREPLMEELKDELAAVAAACDAGSHKLVAHIYKVHPPKCGSSAPDMSPDAMRKGLLTAISHYHPDKQARSKHGAKWCLLCEEITKYLNRKYSLLKGV